MSSGENTGCHDNLLAKSDKTKLPLRQHRAPQMADTQGGERRAVPYRRVMAGNAVRTLLAHEPHFAR